MSAFAVKFLSGKYQGGEFPLPDEGEIIIGRASDLDMVLVEDMVSRKHAKLAVSGGKVSITDLGSTNGSFINGKKVRRAEVKLGDRVLLGTSILKLIRADEMTTAAASAENAEQAQLLMDEMASSQSVDTSMSGELEDVPLPDLLQLFASNQRTGILTVSGANRGKVFMKDGMMIHVIIAGELQMPPMKAFCRMLTWSEGHFSFEQSEPPAEIKPSFNDKTESLLLEGLRQIDELRRMLHELPPPTATVVIARPLEPKLSQLSTEELDILQLVINHGVLRVVVDHSLVTDFNVCRVLHKLLSKGYIEVSR